MKSLLVGFLLCGIGWAQNDPHNGYWWKALTDTQKAAYLLGYVDGAVDGSTHLGLRNRLKKVDISRATAEVVGPGTYGQLHEGIDKFYTDYRNVGIGIGSAIAYVNDDVGGAAAPILEREVELMRQNAARESTSSSASSPPVSR